MGKIKFMSARFCFIKRGIITQSKEKCSTGWKFSIAANQKISFTKHFYKISIVFYVPGCSIECPVYSKHLAQPVRFFSESLLYNFKRRTNEQTSIYGIFNR